MRNGLLAVLFLLCAFPSIVSGQPAAEVQCRTETETQKSAETAKNDCTAKHTSDTEKACANDSKLLAQANTRLTTCTSLVTNQRQPPVNDLPAKVAKLQDDLAKQKDSDFELELGIGSLVNNKRFSDYSNNSNLLSVSNLGRASPQYLVGLGLRTVIPGFRHFGPGKDKCTLAREFREGLKTKEVAESLGSLGCPYWREKPFSGFVSVKFSPQSSDSIVGYMLGGSYSAGRFLNILAGFGLTHVNEPSNGLRTSASLYVAAQQKQGNLMNFDPVAMLSNGYGAFDGFSLLDNAGKLVYSGTPLEPHYRGGFVIGIAVPINFSDFLQGK